MALQINWQVEGRVIHEKFRGKMSSQTIHEHEAALAHYLKQGQAPNMHLLVDFSELDDLPPLYALQHNRWAQHPRLGHVVVYGLNNKPTQWMAKLILSFAGVRHRFARDEQDAIAKLQAMDVTLSRQTSVS